MQFTLLHKPYIISYITVNLHLCDTKFHPFPFILSTLTELCSEFSLRSAVLIVLWPESRIYRRLFDLLGWPTVTAGSNISFHTCVHPSVPTFRNLAKQNKFQMKIMFTTGDRDCGSGRVDHWWHLSCNYFVLSGIYGLRSYSFLYLQQNVITVAAGCSFYSSFMGRIIEIQEMK